MHNTAPHVVSDGNLTVITVPSREHGVTRFMFTVALAVPGICSHTALSILADMYERGSKKYEKDTYERKLLELGASVDWSTGLESLTLSVVTRTEHLASVLSLVKDALMHPLFLEAELLKVKKEYLQALHEERDDARTVATHLFSRMVYSAREAAYIPAESVRKKEIERMTPDDLARVHALLSLQPAVLSIASSEHGPVVELFRSLHKRGTGSDTQSDAAPILEDMHAHTEHIHIPGKQNIEFVIGHKVPLLLTDPDYLPLSFGIDVLGKRGGFAGRLMSTVREKEGLTYMIYAWTAHATSKRHGHWQISTFFTPVDAAQGLESTVREVRAITQSGISRGEYETFKELITNQFLLAHDSMAATLSLYHTGVVRGWSLDDIVRYQERIQSLSRDHISHALKRYLDQDALCIASAGPHAPAHIEKN